jgi:HD-GYP domain-containing protein (c-di-GMP phosphodiesterase class II)
MSFRSRFLRMSIAWKLTFFFTVSSLVVAYGMFLVLGGMVTQRMMDLTANFTYAAAESFLPDRSVGYLDGLETVRGTGLEQVSNVIGRISTKSIRGLTLYYRNATGGEWKEVRFGKSGTVYREAVDGAMSGHLERTLGKRIYFPHPSRYFGQSDTFPIIIDLARPGDGVLIEVGLRIDRFGIMNIARENLADFLAFILASLVFTIVIGHLFAMSFSKPIQRLAKEARDFAAGTRETPFSIPSRDEIGSLAGTLNTMKTRLDARVSEVEEKIRAMEAMNGIDRAVLSSISRKRLMNKVVEIVSDFLNAKKVTVMLRNTEMTGFDIIASVTRNGPADERVFIEDAELNSTFFLRIQDFFETDRGEAERVFIDEKAGSPMPADATVINAPLFKGKDYLGSMIIVTGKRLSSDEKNSVRMLADQASVALRNVEEFEENESTSLGILVALTRAIDAKSRWTAGHSQRVAGFSVRIGIRLMMEEKELEELRISALLHDIGKIGVPEYILDKPGRLTTEEFEKIKRHPRMGVDIIEDIPSLARIQPAVLYHHERWDGSGYPEGIAGESIPLFSRIITVSDVYDAITSERPYRSGMDEATALAFMKENAGKIFDPRLARLFLETLEEA